MKLICENSNSSHINANGVRGDAAGTIGQLDTLLPLCTLGIINAGKVDRKLSSDTRDLENVNKLLSRVYNANIMYSCYYRHRKLNYVVNYTIISMRCDQVFLGCPAPYTLFHHAYIAAYNYVHVCM